MSRLFGPVMQNGYLVDDLDRAIAHWVEVMGVGPFFVIPDVRMVDPVYRGQPCAAEISIALANSGDLQIELVLQKNAAPSVYREWLDEGRLGLHHVGFFVDDIEACVAALPAPVERLQHGRNFCYIDTVGHPGTMVELIQRDAGMRGLFDMIRAASVGWQGEDPVRRLG
ncbi:MAG: VOC family protein [Pseudomonadales bacterium]|nr:VOC family protein [Pseudomonadales bacterium]